jgi:TROVE domain.
MRINEKKERLVVPPSGTGLIEGQHLNFMDGPSYDIKSPLLKLICMSASSFFGEPMYYKGMAPDRKKDKGGRVARGFGDDHLGSVQRKYLRSLLNAVDDYEWRNMTPVAAMEKVIDDALDFDPEATLQWAATLRREEFIRTTPQVILIRAANHPKVRGTGLTRKYAALITGRMDEPAVQLAYQLSAFGDHPVPNAMKRAWKDVLSEANEYQLAKYRMEDRVVKTVDVANLAMGKGFYGYNSPIGKLMRGELKLGEGVKTWESIRSGGGSWEEAIEVMGHMALLRNIRNLLEAKVPYELWLKKLVATAAKGQQLPFRYLSAHNANKGAPGVVLDAIEECLEISVGSLPTLSGRSLVLTDNSGSAHGCAVSELSTMTVSQIGNLMGVLTGLISEEGFLGIFGDRLTYLPIRKKASIMDQAVEANKIGKGIGGGTENGIWLALDQAIQKKEHWDNIFVYSDMQAGHGGLYGRNHEDYKQYQWGGNKRFIDVPLLVSEYRAKVNSKVNVFLVQIAGYEDVLLPEYYDRTYIIGGWSGSIFKFAKRMIDTSNKFQQ